MAKVRVYELAKELDIDSKDVLKKLNDMGEFVRSASSTVEPPVYKRLRDALAEGAAAGHPPATRGPWVPFGHKVRTRRLELGMTQAQLSEAVGAKGSWVSQVESGTIEPSPARVSVLAALLGQDLNGMAADIRGEGPLLAPPAEDGLTLALLWRGRADLLARLGPASHDRDTRLRFDRLSRDLLDAASRHPDMREHLDRGQLRSLPALAEQAPERVRQLVAVELAGMVIDAPQRVEQTVTPRLELLDFVLEDLRLGQAHASLAHVFLEPIRERPSRRDLPACGGAIGLTSVVRGGADQDTLLLLGFDPAGWLGVDFIGGQWLLAGPLPESQNPGEREVAARTMMPMAAAGVGAAVAAAMGAGVVLPVLAGLVVGAAAAAEGARDRAATDPSGKPDAIRIARLSLAFGWAWTRIEVTKALAIYAAFGDSADWLPPPIAVADNLGEATTWLRATGRDHTARFGPDLLADNGPGAVLNDVAASLHEFRRRLLAPG